MLGLKKIIACNIILSDSLNILQGTFLFLTACFIAMNLNAPSWKNIKDMLVSVLMKQLLYSQLRIKSKHRQLLYGRIGCGGDVSYYTYI